MAFSSNSGSSGAMSEINVTPLVDVMLVLLIIFMMTAPMLTHRINIDLPQPNDQIKPPENPPEPLRLTIQADGSLVSQRRADQRGRAEAAARACTAASRWTSSRNCRSR